MLTTNFVLPTYSRQIVRTAPPQISVASGVLLLTTNLLSLSNLKYMRFWKFTALVMIVPLVITLPASSWLVKKVLQLR